MRRVDKMLAEFQEVLQAKGVNVEMKEVKEMIDFNDNVDGKFMETQLNYEKELNNYDGLANAVKCFYNTST